MSIHSEPFSEDLKKLIKETIQEEFLKIRAELVPYVSDEEQKEINSIYNEPSKTREIEKSISIDL